MLRTWQVSHFKSIRKMSGPLEFAPLTVFCGSNSSGKSSLLQSILLFKQTLQKEIEAPRMALNGALVRLGSFGEIRTNGTDGEISCVFRIDDYRLKKNGAGSGGNDPAMPAKNEPETSTECGICFDKPRDRPEKEFSDRYPLVTRMSITDMLAKKSLLDCSRMDKEKLEFPLGAEYLLKGEAVFHKSVSEAWNISPGSWNANDAFTEPQRQFYEKMRGKAAYHFAGAFPRFFPYVTFENPDLEARFNGAVKNIRRFFRDKLYYVGPLRSDPKENGDTASQYKGVGYRGEYTAECYALNSYRWTETYPCFFGYEDSNESGVEDKMKTILRNLAEGRLNSHKEDSHLRSSVFEWLRYIGIADYFDDNDILGADRNGELLIQQGQGKRSLKNVGFGVSQVLPIILQCILAEPDSTIIIEQPELHLHPKIQSRLADFFLVMSLIGKQIIIETHSEYIIDKLRLRIVQAPDDTLVDGIAIYFAEKRDGNSEFRRIRINEYSVMSEWSEGFFEESMRIARDILFAARQKEKGKGGPEEKDD
jgi:predicted ATPase